MKKLFVTIFIIIAITTPLFFSSKLQKVEAINDPAITSLVFNGPELPSMGKENWTWDFTLKTNEYVSSDAVVDFSISEKDKGGVPYLSNSSTVGETHTMHYPLEKVIPADGKTYVLEWVIKTRYCDNGYDNSFTRLSATYECSAGGTSKCNPPVIINKIPTCVPPPPVDKPTIVNLDKSAPAPNGGVYTLLAPIGNLTTAPDNLGDYFNTIFTLAIGLCGVLAVIMIVIGGVQYMGDESIFGKTEAKSRITSAILGLLIALGSYALLNTINPDLLGKGGIKINSVSAGIEEETTPWSTYETGDNTAGCPSGVFTDVITNANPAKINVCSSIADNLSKMIAAAKANNPSIILSGTGSRKISTTQALRVQNNCPDPKTPSTQCKPNAVAIPGTSNHEKGLAVDFNCNGNSMTPDKTNTNNVCYVWLSKNAAQFGFKNNFSALKETWHWSTTGS